MKTALYLRVSTIEQSTENQLPDLEALAKRRGFEVVQTFSEKVSAVKTRPEFDAMIGNTQPCHVVIGAPFAALLARAHAREEEHDDDRARGATAEARDGRARAREINPG